MNNIHKNYTNQTDTFLIIEGFIDYNESPKYQQTGEFVNYDEDVTYLVLKISNVMNILAPDDRGVVNTFLTIQCGAETKKTRTIKNHQDPIFNTTVCFKIPTDESSIINKVKKKHFIEEQIKRNHKLREQINNRARVIISLWLDGGGLQSDDNLGFLEIPISDIQGGKRVKQQRFDIEKNQIISFYTNVKTYQASFDSSKQQANIMINFQMYFAPDLHEELELSGLQQQIYDYYPNDYNQQLRDSEKTIIQQIVDNPPIIWEQWKNRIKLLCSDKYNKISIVSTKILYNFLFMKDQFNKRHLICKYLNPFCLQKRSIANKLMIAKDIMNINPQLISSLCHYVRTIEFPMIQKYDFIQSPGQFISLKNGNELEHANLLASLIMGNTKPDFDSITTVRKNEEVNQFKVKRENRTFVCIGTKRNTGEIAAWVMLLTENLKNAIFLSVNQNQQWTLENRVVNDAKSDAFIKDTFQTKTKSINQKFIKQQQEINNKFINLYQDNRYLEMVNFLQYSSNYITMPQYQEDHFQGVFKQLQDQLNKKIQGQVVNPSDKKTYQKPKLKKFTIQRSYEDLRKNCEFYKEKSLWCQRQKDLTDEITHATQLETIDIIYNNKNVWANVQQLRHPAEVNYRLNDPMQWYPFIQNESKIKECINNSREDIHTEYYHSIYNINMNPLGHFQDICNIGQPIPNHVTKELEQQIINKTLFMITLQRNSKSLETEFKPQNTKIVFYLKKLMNIQEYASLGYKEELLKMLKKLDWRLLNQQASKNDENNKDKKKNKNYIDRFTSFGMQGDSKRTDFLDQEIQSLKSLEPFLNYWDDNMNNFNFKKMKQGQAKEAKIYYDQMSVNGDKAIDQIGLYNLAEKLWIYQMKKLLPLNYYFVALPMYFKYSSPSQIETTIRKKAGTILNASYKNIVFAFTCSIYNYQNSINSIRCVLAIFFESEVNIIQRNLLIRMQQKKK